MKQQQLSQSEKIKIFLNEYYFGYGPFYSFMRIIGGPVILGTGLHLYQNAPAKFGVGYGGFMIAFGGYYLLNPLIIMLTQKAWFKNFDLTYLIEDEKITVMSGKSRSELDYSEFVTVLKRKTYFTLKTKSKQALYLPLTLLESNEIAILENLSRNSGK